mmetsp:Transcript_49509/g.137492  ORF Transcript_49509/g.137492 Transcript_49509/m.137492 type:complete len:210 (+) Transcript_49509:286-915(+)
MFFVPTAVSKPVWHSPFRALITSSCSFKSSFNAFHASLFRSISASSSSTRSLNFPHCNDMVSCRRPQFTFPSVHFFHCIDCGGDSLTGVGFGVTPDCTRLPSTEVASSANASALIFEAKPRPNAESKAFLTPGVIICSTFAWVATSSNVNSKPWSLLQTCTGAELLLDTDDCNRRVVPLHFVMSMMKLKTARSFFFTVKSCWFAARIPS